MAPQSKAAKIKKERKRLLEKYRSLPSDALAIVIGLIDRAAFLRPTLEEMEADLDKNGTVESFQQSDSVPAYDRERPVARQYVQLTKNYQAIIKQLDAKLPKVAVAQDDGFDDFLNARG